MVIPIIYPRNANIKLLIIIAALILFGSMIVAANLIGSGLSNLNGILIGLGIVAAGIILLLIGFRE